MEEINLEVSTTILEGIVMALTSSTQATITVSHTATNSLEFLIFLPKSEAGRVIGKYGDVIKSIRSIMYGITMHQYRLRSNVIVEPH